MRKEKIIIGAVSGAVALTATAAIVYVAGKKNRELSKLSANKTTMLCVRSQLDIMKSLSKNTPFIQFEERLNFGEMVNEFEQMYIAKTNAGDYKHADKIHETIFEIIKNMEKIISLAVVDETNNTISLESKEFNKILKNIDKLKDKMYKYC